jgi:MYXO-CTERM domain-containing protein
MHNIKWENNTVVQHKGSLNQGILMIVYTATASGMSGGQLYADSIYWTNNLFVADGVNFQTPDSRVIQTSNLIIKNATTQDPGFVNLKGSTAKDYDLVATSPAVNAGTLLANRTLDFLNRTIPDSSGKADIGAFEYGSTQVTPPPVTPGGGAGGSPGGTGGTTGVTTPAGTGGSTTGPKGTGGTTSTPSGTGGVVAGAGGKTGSIASGSGGTTTVPPTGSGGSTGSGNGGSSVAGVGGAGSGGALGSGGATTGGGDTGKSGCSCRLGRLGSGPGLWAGLVGLALLALRRRRRSKWKPSEGSQTLPRRFAASKAGWLRTRS